MREIRTSGLMSGDGKRDGAPASAPAPILDSTHAARFQPVKGLVFGDRVSPSPSLRVSWRR